MLSIAKLINLDKNLILASISPRRKKLMEQLGFEFKVVPSHIIEPEYESSVEPAEYATELACKKATEVSDLTNEDAIIIAADTVVFIGHEVLNKPKDEAEAIEMLRKLSGHTHTVYTGIAITDSKTKRLTTAVQATDVTFRELDENEIIAYVKTGSPLDKAGAYGIQDDFGAVFVSNISGCYYNIVGLPLELLYTKLKEFING